MESEQEDTSFCFEHVLCWMYKKPVCVHDLCRTHNEEAQAIKAEDQMHCGYPWKELFMILKAFFSKRFLKNQKKAFSSTVLLGGKFTRAICCSKPVPKQHKFKGRKWDYVIKRPPMEGQIKENEWILNEWNVITMMKSLVTESVLDNEKLLWVLLTRVC